MIPGRATIVAAIAGAVGYVAPLAQQIETAFTVAQVMSAAAAALFGGLVTVLWYYIRRVDQTREAEHKTLKEKVEKLEAWRHRLDGAEDERAKHAKERS